MARIRSVSPECEVLPKGWWLDYVHSQRHVMPETADEMLNLIVLAADRQGRYYGDPRLVWSLMHQTGDLTHVEALIDELIARGDLRMGCAHRRPGGSHDRMLYIVNRSRFPRWRNRQWVPLAVRREVMERDNGTCQECGTTDQPTIDHIVPFSHGGPDTPDNLRVLCKPCNSRKGNRIGS